jgi:uncharacterized protein YbgA (DUF1722 family)/uncharacterized protein YbbK (DUF523 family)
MTDMAEPRLVVSRCLGFEACRFNGQIISAKIIERLKPHVVFIQVCPEVEIGLGTPRDPVRIVDLNGQLRLVQPKTGRDVTSEMQLFAKRFLGSLTDVDGFILKSRSPTCGTRDVKIYPGFEKVAAISKGVGCFGGPSVNRFPYSAIEDEGRLNNFTIREWFLTKIFAFARFRNAKATQSMTNLLHFHTTNKLLLEVYNQRETGILGRIIANHDHRIFSEVVSDYELHLRQALMRTVKKPSVINGLLHAFGHFSKQLTHEEKSFFLDNLDDYRTGKVPLSAILSVIGSWIIRFNNDYLKEQTFFEPYPKDLVEISDSGKGRAY